jgi:hypothetical protein
MLALIDDYHGAVSGEFRDFAEQDIKQCLLAIALGEANVSSIDAAQSGVSIEDWRSRKMNWGNPP